MHNYISYKSYSNQLRQYFVYGLSKIMDLGNINQIEYPTCMTDQEANAFDANELKNDFITVGKDLGKALDLYGRRHTI